jgi:hypothetical protein
MVDLLASSKIVPSLPVLPLVIVFYFFPSADDGVYLDEEVHDLSRVFVL